MKRTKPPGPCQPAKEKTKVAVRNLSVAVEEGEVLGLLGPNGAGKSTALNMMIAEEGPSRGQVDMFYPFQFQFYYRSKCYIPILMQVEHLTIVY